jgi:hypothetical protein
MTPEEKVVIEAAMKLRLTHLNNRAVMAGAAASELVVAVDALIYSCPKCNAGGHTCPGDGNPIGHTATDCGEHEIKAFDTCSARGMVSGGTLGAVGCIRRGGHEGRHGYSDGSGEHGRDTAESAILAGELSASTYPCWECLTDPTEDPAPWCDDRPEDFGQQNPNHACRLRAHAPADCPNRIGPEDDLGIYGIDESQEAVVTVKADDPVWVETTMTNCLINDRIRIGAEETTVLRSNHGLWHVDGQNYWQPVRWDHIELRMELESVPGFRQYPPAASIEILCTPERLAVLRLQEAFPGATPGITEIRP